MAAGEPFRARFGTGWPGHGERQINRGEADWRIYGLLADGRHFVIAYDHPHGSDHAAVKIVSV